VGADDRFLSSAIWPSISLVALFLFSLQAAENGNKIKPGEFVIDHPTLINLGFEWLIEGDDNRNAQVEVSYRKHGETQWKQGLPPYCVCRANESIRTRVCFDVVSPNMFAGSILDLEPDTEYEARFCDVRSRRLSGAKRKDRDQDRDSADAR